MSTSSDRAPTAQNNEPLWVDSHCHLDMLKLLSGEALEFDGDQDPITEPFLKALSDELQLAYAAGVGHFLCVSVDVSRYERMRRAASVSPRVAHSAGIHPSTLESRPEAQWIDVLRQWLADEAVVAVGETGLDYHYDTVSVAEQQSRFAAHIAFSQEFDKPLIIHTREARADTIALLKSEGRGDARGVMHCFTETWDMAKQALDLGFYISFSGIVTFNSAHDLRDVVKKVPMDRILVETDSPYLAPVPHRGKANTPRFVAVVGEKVAELKGLPVETVARQTTDNYFSLFRGARRIGMADWV